MKKVYLPLLSLILMLSCNQEEEQTAPSNIYTGPAIFFEKTDGADWTDPANQDRITPNVWLTRADRRPIFNIAQESEATFNPDSLSEPCAILSPIGTKWAFGNTANLDSLVFDQFLNTVRCVPGSVIGRDMVLYLEEEDVYIDIRFNSWSVGDNGGQGGFSYTRKTR